MAPMTADGRAERSARSCEERFGARQETETCTRANLNTRRRKIEFITAGFFFFLNSKSEKLASKSTFLIGIKSPKNWSQELEVLLCGEGGVISSSGGCHKQPPRLVDHKPTEDSSGVIKAQVCVCVWGG